MKALLRNTLFVVSGLLFAHGPAYCAQWVDVQGTNAVIEYPGNTTNSAAGSAATYYKGWGLDFVQKAYTDNWVHSSVPSIGAQTATQIEVKYYKQYANASITDVHIYNGNTPVLKTVAPTSSTAGWNYFTISLGGTLSFPYGLGVSLHVVPAPGADTDFQIGDVGAYFN